MSRQFGGLGPNRQIEKARLLVIISILLVIVIAGAAFLFLSGGGGGGSQAAAVVVQREDKPLRTVNVLVPLQRIEPGMALEPSMFRQEPRPALSVSPRSIDSFQAISGYYARSVISPGEPLVQDSITMVRPTNPISAKIPEGFRAVTINVNSTSSVEGWAAPGAKVDVVWASKIRGQPGVSVIVQNASVLSAERMTDQSMKPGTPVPSTVTLLVTADDANKIMLATTTGSLSLSLRGDSDSGKGVGGGSITVEQLFGGTKQEPTRSGSGMGIKVRGPDGKLQEMEFVNGKLVPVS